MKKGTRRVDADARMTLFRDFAGAKVTIEGVGAEEVRIRKVSPRTRKYTLKELVEKITPKNRHDEIFTGMPVGGEAW